MMPWRTLWKTEALVLAVLVGCSATPRTVRVEAGAGGHTVVHIPRADTVEPVQVTPEEVTQALRRLAREVRLSGSPRETVERLFQLDALYGDYLYLLQERKLVPLASGTPLEGTLTEGEEKLVSRYKTRPGVGAPIVSRTIVWGARSLAGSTWTCKAATCWPWP